MTRKKIKYYADKIAAYERICRDPESSKEDKQRAQSGMVNICNIIMVLPDWMNSMAQIDKIVQHKMKNKE